MSKLGHEHRAARLNGTALKERLPIGNEMAQRRDGLPHRDVERTIEHDAERAIRIVLADEDDRVAKVRIEEAAAGN
jgi:hypothetical protein